MFVIKISLKIVGSTLVAVLPKVAELANAVNGGPRLLKNVTISQLIRVLGHAVHNLQHSSGLVSDKALGFASCFIIHLTTPFVR